MPKITTFTEKISGGGVGMSLCLGEGNLSIYFGKKKIILLTGTEEITMLRLEPWHCIPLIVGGGI